MRLRVCKSFSLAGTMGATILGYILVGQTVRGRIALKEHVILPLPPVSPSQITKAYLQVCVVDSSAIVLAHTVKTFLIWKYCYYPLG